MVKNVFVVASLASLLPMSWGCQRSDPALNEKLDRLEAKLDTISRKVDTMGSGRAQPPRPERRGADPGLVYSVPVGDSPVKGPATAKVTIIEAAEFA